MEDLRASTDPASLKKLNHALDSHSNISSETFLKVYKEQATVTTLFKKEYHKTLKPAKAQGFNIAAPHIQHPQTSAIDLITENVSNGSQHVDKGIEAWVAIDPLPAIEERKLEFEGLLLQAERTYNVVRYLGILR